MSQENTNIHFRWHVCIKYLKMKLLEGGEKACILSKKKKYVRNLWYLKSGIPAAG